ncbi:MAG: MFS transporter, partial [Pirellulaceae bacterium]|nr:MFS transporter [Pirellulaceae bacterium]
MLATPDIHDDQQKWFEGITRYQWVVLIIASLGWVFDVFEGQIFVASMNEAMPSLEPTASTGDVAVYNNIALGAFLLGGALGGIVFGLISDRIGRTKTMSITILFYSVFTCLSALSQTWWHMSIFRFLVAMGVGGEWAIASAMVYEVFPRRARAHVGGIFHASSVFGTYLAVAVGYFVIGSDAIQTWANSLDIEWFDPQTIPWRLGFAIGVVPALLIIWIRLSLKEPDNWQAARAEASTGSGKKMGSLTELFSSEFLRKTLVGVSLAAIGLATFWGAHIYAKNVLKDSAINEMIEARLASETSDTQNSLIEATTKQRESIRAEIKIDSVSTIKGWEMFGMLITATGGGIGLITFGPLCQRIGRIKTFMFFHCGGFISAMILFNVPLSTTYLYTALPVFGFLTLGMHAGYAI